MSALSDLFGANGAVRQLFLWGLVNQVISAEFGPFMTALQQDAAAAHPLAALPADMAADAVARRLMTRAEGEAEAARSGIDPGRFATMVERATVRIPPADLAEAVLRSYLTHDQAVAEARPQGWTPEQLGILTDLAGDAPGPQQLAAALRRGLIPEKGTGAAAVSYQQGIAEGRLHDKWGPLLFQLTQALLSPADVASAMVRNFIDQGQGEHLAGLQGVDVATLDIMRNLAGDAPAPGQLAEALRRGLIPADGTGPAVVSFSQGIAEGRLADKWAPVIQGLSRLWPTPTDALDAMVKGQLTAQEGTALYERLGGDPEFLTWLLGTIGSSPTPLEAALMAARGVIPWHGLGPDAVSYDQAVKESRYKDKWSPVYRALAEHIPPPSTVVTLLAHQQATHEQAAQWLAENDVRPDVIPAYLGEAQYTAISDYRGLTQSAVTDMYYARLISRDQATQILSALHVSGQAAGLLLDYADLRVAIANITTSARRVLTLLVTHKITAQTASDSLLKLGVPASTVEQVVQQAEVEASANVRTLTETQIVDAWYYGILDQATAQSELVGIGYTPYDAWTLLSVKAKGPLPDQPARIVAPPQGAVIPGVT